MHSLADIKVERNFSSCWRRSREAIENCEPCKRYSYLRCVLRPMLGVRVGFSILVHPKVVVLASDFLSLKKEVRERSEVYIHF